MIDPMLVGAGPEICVCDLQVIMRRGSGGQIDHQLPKLETQPKTSRESSQIRQKVGAWSDWSNPIPCRFHGRSNYVERNDTTRKQS